MFQIKRLHFKIMKYENLIFNEPDNVKNNLEFYTKQLSFLEIEFSKLLAMLEIKLKHWYLANVRLLYPSSFSFLEGFQSFYQKIVNSRIESLSGKLESLRQEELILQALEKRINQFSSFSHIS